MIWLLNLLFPHVTILREGGLPYLTRWCLLGGSPYDSKHPFLPFNLFLHLFHASDARTPHDHPWTWAKSVILRGAYVEHRNGRHRVFSPGSVNRISADTSHWVELLTDCVWTLFFVGRKVQKWGFHTPEGFEMAKTYLAKVPGATSNDRVVDE